MKLICWVFLLLANFGCCLPLFGEEAFFRAGFVDINGYPYLSNKGGDNTYTVNMAAQAKAGFSYFSLTNFGEQTSSVNGQRRHSYYTEQNIRWKINDRSPLDLTYQGNFRSGASNDRHRLGVRWRLHDTPGLATLLQGLNLSYSVNWHALQFDTEAGRIWQLEHVFNLRFPALSDRLSLAGFIDHTFNQELPSSFPSAPVVAEAQLGYQLFDNFSVAIEYRINQYRRSDVNSLGIGVAYKFNW